MSVDYYICNRCNEIYDDCRYFVTCDEDAGGCGRHWCSDECAEKDGYRKCSCKLGKDIDDQGYAEDECEHLNDKYDYCGDCENFIESSCKHCRNEDFEEEDIIDYILKEYTNNKSIDEIKEEMRLNYNK